MKKEGKPSCQIQNKNIPSEQENPLFHDTWKLLKNYRDAVWNLELAVQ